MTQPLEHVSFDKPDEVREGENWRMELVNLAGGAQVGRITLQPGWRWSDHVKPAAMSGIVTESPAATSVFIMMMLGTVSRSARHRSRIPDASHRT